MRVSRPAHSRSPRTNFWTLPVEVFGSGPNSIASGHLWRASRWLRHRMGVEYDRIPPVIFYLPTGPLSNRVLLTKADPQEVPASDLIRASQKIVQVIAHREEAAS
jgi:hypothetical protein